MLELVAELGGTTTEELELEALDPGATEELDPKSPLPSTLELLTNQSTLDEEAATDGVSGDGESSEQALYIATAPAANIELNKIFFIIIL
uniref:Putative CAMP-dependent protein kinase, beta-catalytic subunit n=1 Tax=uncultured bacterium Ad_125_H07_contig2 TaxID=1489300 RepID=A0A0B4N1A6_9BACT|nr:putative CAMP-dependent protein kinase, beta-catalytic subunit [uncultured bacterium Ad_125_H07_contig2]